MTREKENAELQERAHALAECFEILDLVDLGRPRDREHVEQLIFQELREAVDAARSVPLE